MIAECRDVTGIIDQRSSIQDVGFAQGGLSGVGRVRRDLIAMGVVVR